MSGICGIVRLDGGEVEAAEIDALLAALAHRGPDGTRQWRMGEVALGHALLATTPEAAVERLPLTDAASGCTITADARLDNREELMAALGQGEDGRVIGDGELILRAYLAWGEDCPARLLGDFAFAIWDQREGRLFCARDQMGMRQFNYCHLPGQAFVFATEADAILTLPFVPSCIHEGRIADFLENIEGHDLVSTWFEKISRLPPAHCIALTVERLEIRRYWRLTAPPELRLASDEEYVDAFLAVFREAVACRLRSVGPIGVSLSGGIDSNSIAAVAARMLAADGRTLLTYSVVGPNPVHRTETVAIEAAIRNPQYTPTLIDYGNLGGRARRYAQLARQCREPFDAHMSLLRAVYDEANRAGVKVVFDGAGGDIVLASGNALAELLSAGRWRAALGEINRRPRTARELFGEARQFLASCFAALAPAPVVRWRRRLASAQSNRRALAGKDLIHPDFARRIDLPKRRARLASHGDTLRPFGREYRRLAVIHPHLVAGRERYDRTAAMFGIEPRDPFVDVRLASFCLSLPTDQVHRRGITKAILRRAMRDLCPPEVWQQRARRHHGWDFTQALLPELARIATFDRQQLAAFSQPQKLARAKFDADRALDRHRWFELCVLSEWLYRNARPYRGE